VRQNGATSNAVTLKIGQSLAENVNPVASPVSMPRATSSQRSPASVAKRCRSRYYRISPEGDMDGFATDIVNPTGLAFDADGLL